MVPCHSCHIYGTWRSKEVGRGEVLKSSNGRGGQVIKEGRNFYEGKLNFLDTINAL